MDDTLEIRMQTDEIECAVCGYPAPFRYGIPTYNGDLVSNDFPLWDTGNRPVCRGCFECHERGELDTYDRYYVWPGPLGVVLLDGGGI